MDSRLVSSVSIVQILKLATKASNRNSATHQMQLQALVSSKVELGIHKYSSS